MLNSGLTCIREIRASLWSNQIIFETMWVNLVAASQLTTFFLSVLKFQLFRFRLTKALRPCCSQMQVGCLPRSASTSATRLCLHSHYNETDPWKPNARNMWEVLQWYHFEQYIFHHIHDLYMLNKKSVRVYRPFNKFVPSIAQTMMTTRLFIQQLVSSHRRSQRGGQGAMPPKFLEYLVLLCF